MTATEHDAEINRCTDVAVVQQRHREVEGIGNEGRATGSKTASGSKKKKKKKKKASSGVLIYKNLVGGPFKITESATVGRCVVTAKDLEAGEMILSEPPFAKVNSPAIAIVDHPIVCGSTSDDRWIDRWQP